MIVNLNPPQEPSELDQSPQAVIAKAFEDGTKAGLTIAIQQLEKIRDSMSIDQVLQDAENKS